MNAINPAMTSVDQPTGGDLAEFLIRHEGDPDDIYGLHKAVYDRFLASGQVRQFLFCPVSTGRSRAILFRGQASLLRTIAPRAHLGRTFIPEVGQSVPFLLRANPLYKVDGARKQMPCSSTWDERRLAWLDRRAAERGFAVRDVTVQAQSLFVKKQATRDYYMNVAVYRGVLQVTDAGLMRDTMGRSLGRASTYGNGVLICQRPS